MNACSDKSSSKAARPKERCFYVFRKKNKPTIATILFACFCFCVFVQVRKEAWRRSPKNNSASNKQKKAIDRYAWHELEQTRW